jgi:hypothetical protein
MPDHAAVGDFRVGDFSVKARSTRVVSCFLSGFASSAISLAAKGFNDLFEKTSPTVSGSIATQGAATNH